MKFAKIKKFKPSYVNAHVITELPYTEGSLNNSLKTFTPDFYKN